MQELYDIRTVQGVPGKQEKIKQTLKNSSESYGTLKKTKNHMLLEDFFMEKKEHFYRTHPILFSLLASEVIGIVIGMAGVYTSFGITFFFLFCGGGYDGGADRNFLCGAGHAHDTGGSAALDGEEAEKNQEASDGRAGSSGTDTRCSL